MELQLKDAKFYREMAKYCEARVKNVRGDALKDVIKDTARSWREIADRIERRARRKPPSLPN